MGSSSVGPFCAGSSSRVGGSKNESSRFPHPCREQETSWHCGTGGLWQIFHFRCLPKLESSESLCERRSLPSLTQSVAPVHRPGRLRCGESQPLVCSLCRRTIPSQSSQCYFCACSSV